jgi:putative NIF3 family GTP cyclohydrolase 1 type 2
MGIDLYITGEAHEWNREIFKEAGINFIAGGHYNTEIFGIKALMDYVKSNFKGIDCSWLDLENDI